MRVKTSVTLISLLFGSLAVGLHPTELSGLKQVPSFLLSHLDPQSPYLAHRGSGRIEGPFVSMSPISSMSTVQNLA